MKKIFTLLFVVCLVSSAGFCLAQDIEDLKVEEIKICKAVIDRMPIEPSASFSEMVEKLYCYTRVTGANQDTNILHIWKYDDEEMSRVLLKIGASPSWRTWSSKDMLEIWKGKWSVEVVSANGDILAKKEFFLEPKMEKLPVTPPKDPASASQTAPVAQ